MIRFFKSLLAEVLWFVNKSLYLKVRFYRSSGYWPNINDPRNINEIILKFKVESPEEYHVYADKILVRDFIEKKIYENKLTRLRLPEILLESTSAEDFAKKFNGEESFIKANHGSGMCLYFDGETRKSLTAKQISLMKSWLNTDYYKFSGEACYKNINRKIFAEKPLRCKDGSLPDDIKVHCYCGKPAVIQILRRTTGVLERKTYDENWVEKPWFKNEVLVPDLSLIPKEEVLLYSEALSIGFDYVRVDFYLVDDLLYFSELTFYPASASLPLATKQVDEELGAKYRKLCD
ncbi:ATP-grasp fold amidoligase family protein [Venatoribacter cucullus]|uniref:ATP-grasp fold amidoligase family protein n=1 Tax=Venatoribacter cucullus TaxID=2661630 RepID=UPI00223FFE59|nr:ATP-grasp fold amidoligase family protein [Venatoribacter cucullus]UZK03148.1 hypothetical protein GAY96_04110 [Venatoribacter cucullus]